MNMTVPTKRTRLKGVRTHRIEPETCAEMVFDGPIRLTPVSQKNLHLRSGIKLTDEGLLYVDDTGERVCLFRHVGLRVLKHSHAHCRKQLQIAHIDSSKTEWVVDLSLADLMREPQLCAERLRSAGFDMPWDQSDSDVVMGVLADILRDNSPGRIPADPRRRS